MNSGGTIMPKQHYAVGFLAVGKELCWLFVYLLLILAIVVAGGYTHELLWSHYAVFAITVGLVLLAALPMLLHLFRAFKAIGNIFSDF
jgi:hypothetical protein